MWLALPHPPQMTKTPDAPVPGRPPGADGAADVAVATARRRLVAGPPPASAPAGEARRLWSPPPPPPSPPAMAGAKQWRGGRGEDGGRARGCGDEERRAALGGDRVGKSRMEGEGGGRFSSPQGLGQGPANREEHQERGNSASPTDHGVPSAALDGARQHVEHAVRRAQYKRPGPRVPRPSSPRDPAQRTLGERGVPGRWCWTRRTRQPVCPPPALPPLPHTR